MGITSRAERAAERAELAADRAVRMATQTRVNASLFPGSVLPAPAPRRMYEYEPMTADQCFAAAERETRRSANPMRSDEDNRLSVDRAKLFLSLAKVKRSLEAKPKKGS